MLILANIIVICGPTASGKTRLAVAIARRIGGEIISADSRQVYRGMDIGTGKDFAEYGPADNRVPVHLIDIADPRTVYSLYNYQKDFYPVFCEIAERGKMPVLVGGTGLYIEALLKNYSIASVPEDADLRLKLMKRAKEDLEKELLERSPELFEKTDRSSKKRIVRSLEIALTQDKHPDTPSRPGIALDPIVIGVRWERSELRARIDQRLKDRLQAGMIDEVRNLMVSGIAPERFDLFGMEYKHIARHLRGEVAYDQMVAALRNDIHHLAKRQETWFRGMERRGIKVHWVDKGDIEQAVQILRVNGIGSD